MSQFIEQICEEQKNMSQKQDQNDKKDDLLHNYHPAFQSYRNQNEGNGQAIESAKHQQNYVEIKDDQQLNNEVIQEEVSSANGSDCQIGPNASGISNQRLIHSLNSKSNQIEKQLDDISLDFQELMAGGLDDLQSKQNNQQVMGLLQFRQRLNQIQNSASQQQTINLTSIKNSSMYPNPFDIQQCMNYLSNQFSKLQLQKAIKALHGIFHNGCENNDEINSMFQPKGDFEANHADYAAIKAIRIKHFIQIPYDQRIGQDKKIVMSFINYGYGLRVLRQMINDPSISTSKYNNFITTVMKITFRKIEEFMKIFGRSVTPITSHDQKVLRSPLINCDRWLFPDELDTYFKFIKITYNIEEDDITPSATMKLYSTIMNQLKKREGDIPSRSNRKIRQVRARNIPKAMKIIPKKIPIRSPYSEYPPNNFIPNRPLASYESAPPGFYNQYAPVPMRGRPPIEATTMRNGPTYKRPMINQMTVQQPYPGYSPSAKTAVKIPMQTQIQQKIPRNTQGMDLVKLGEIANNIVRQIGKS